MNSPLLVYVPYSPWSLKARLALRLGGVPHALRVYLPMLGEPWLRWRTRRLAGRMTVPVLLTDQGAVGDSFEIARLALGGTPLWSDPAAIEAWNAWSERMLALGRIRTTRSTMADPAALRASLPAGLGRLGPFSRLLAWVGARYLLRKYPVDADPAAIERQMDGLLDQLDGVLGDQPYLLGRLTYADITAAVGLCFLSPPTDLPVPDLARPHWTSPALASRYTRLLRWRDGILAECSRAGSPS